MTNKEKFKEIFGIEPDCGRCNPYPCEENDCKYWEQCENQPGCPCDNWWDWEFKEPNTKNDLGVDCIPHFICSRDTNEEMENIRNEIFSYDASFVEYTIEGHSDSDIEKIVENVINQFKDLVLDVVSNHITHETRTIANMENSKINRQEYKEPTTKNNLGVDREDAVERLNAIKQLIGYDKDSEIVKATQKSLDMAIKALKHPEKNVVAVVPCGDCISRAEVLKLMQDNWHTHNGDWAMQESMDDIRALPSVTPQAKDVPNNNAGEILNKLRAKMEEISSNMNPEDEWDYGYKAGVEDLIQFLNQDLIEPKAESEEENGNEAV